MEIAGRNEMKKTDYIGVIIVLAVMLSVLVFAGVFPGKNIESVKSGGENKIRIGVSMDDLRLERWQHDRDILVEKASGLNAEVVVQSANGDDQVQFAQCENLISQGIDVLVIIPHNGDTMAPIVAQAHKAGIKILSYDRLITKSDVDYYISFDNIKVGELQAEAVIKAVPEGNYFLMGGSPTDNNAKLFRQGQMNILQPLIDRKLIKIVGDQWVKDWLPEEAMKIMENALTATGNEIDAVVASNDSTAGGAIQALAAQKLAGKVAVSGQDADLASCQRIVEGTQLMTVYKPIKNLAARAAEIAVAIAKKENVETNGKVDNGKIEVPSILLVPVAVDASNMAETVIQDGFHSKEDVYKNITASSIKETGSAK